MPRYTFAVSDEAIAGLGGLPAPDQLLTVWTSRVDGQQVTTLYDLDDLPLNALRSDARGRFPFRADTDQGYLWVRHGAVGDPNGAVWLVLGVESVQAAATAGAAYPQMSQDVSASRTDAAEARRLATLANADATEALDSVGVAAQLARDFSYSTPLLVGGGPLQYNAWPHIAEAADGSLIIAGGSGDGHTSDHQMSMVWWRSTDKGRTWTRVKTQTEAGWHLSTFCIGRAPSGRLVCLVRKQQEDNSPNRMVQVWTSTTFGATWVLEREFTTTIPFTTVFGFVATDEGLIGAYSTGTGAEALSPYDAWGVLRSTDDGSTWTMEEKARVARNTIGEIRLWRAPDGAVLAVSRPTAGLGDPANVCWSYDDGRTWTPWVPSNITDAHLTPVGLCGRSDTVYAYYLDRSNGQIKRRTARAGALQAAPSAWSAPEPVFDKVYCGSVYDMGYLDALELDNGDHRMTWYAGFRQPKFYTLLGSRFPSRLAGMGPVQVLDEIRFGPAGISSTSTTGASLGSISLPREVVNGGGRLYVRIQGNVRLSLAGTTTLRLNAPEGTVATLELVHPSANSWLTGDTGWLEVPASFLQGSPQQDFDRSALSFTIASNVGTTLASEKTRAMVGVQR